MCVLEFGPLLGNRGDYLGPGTLIEQEKVPIRPRLSTGLRFRNMTGQPELCHEVLTFRGDKLFKESLFIFSGIRLSHILPAAIDRQTLKPAWQTPAQMNKPLW